MISEGISSPAYQCCFLYTEFSTVAKHKNQVNDQSLLMENDNILRTAFIKQFSHYTFTVHKPIVYLYHTHKRQGIIP